MSESANPYQAPHSEEYEEPTLSDDAEFLISAGEILCRETVELPKVCIHTGLTEELVERQQTFHTNRIRLFVPLLILGVILILMSGTAGSVELFFLFVVISLLVTPVCSRLGVPGFVRVSATWYVAQRYLRRCQWEAWIIRGIIFVVTAVLGLAVSHATIRPAAGNTLERVLYGLIPAAVCTAISLFLNVEKRIRCSGIRMRGRHRGLVSLTGHGRRFTEAVERMIHGGF